MFIFHLGYWPFCLISTMTLSVFGVGSTAGGASGRGHIRRPQRRWRDVEPKVVVPTRYFDSATPTSYSTSYTLWDLSLTVTEFVYENVNITPC